MSGRRLLLAGAAAALCVGCGATTSPPATPARSAPAPSGAPTAAPVPVPAAATGAAPAVAPGRRPVRLTVPSIGVDAALVDLGVGADGALQVPTGYTEAGWFDRSPAPGERGPAVLAGHVDSTAGPAVFSRLRDVVPGARIGVTRADGTTVSFRVDGIQQYAKDAFPTAAVYGPAPGPVLRLITCGGTFDRGTGHYRDNIVVYATAIGA